jgi:NAD(P)-dependent dehydrogenase (short-subunit alcohol dehydrogenase family)
MDKKIIFIAGSTRGRGKTVVEALAKRTCRYLTRENRRRYPKGATGNYYSEFNNST